MWLCLVIAAATEPLKPTLLTQTTCKLQVAWVVDVGVWSCVVGACKHKIFYLNFLTWRFCSPVAWDRY